jgi:hypothetical protein
MGKSFPVLLKPLNGNEHQRYQSFAVTTTAAA